MNSLQSKSPIVWITGASTGIGRELALQLAASGNIVYASARTRSTLESLEATQAPHAIRVLPCDVTDRMSLQNATKKIESEVGCIDTVIVNAGTCEYFSVTNPDWKMMQRVMAVNYFGAINTVEFALPLLRKTQHGNGHIVAMASLASTVPFPKAQAYGSSKAAVRYFFESLRVDLAKDNITVTVVQPGFVDTPLTARNDFPMPFMVSPQKAAVTIIRRLKSKPRLIRFPRRLAWMLSTMAHFPGLWHFIATKQLSRSAAEPENQNSIG